METWNRDELYAEVWEQPLVKLAPKYGISAVALGKVCRKLQIPIPGRGYWAKKEFGKPTTQVPLPKGKDIPIVQRLKFPSSEGCSGPATAADQEVPTDPEYLRITDLESRTILIDPTGTRHKFVTATEKAMKRAKADAKNILEQRRDGSCLDIGVSMGTLPRALSIMNAVISFLESEGFPVTLQNGRHGTGAQIFGYRVQFAIVEKLREKARRQVQEYSWTRTIIDYEPKGILEFRAGDSMYGRKLRDRKTAKLETQLSACIGAVLREGRSQLISARRAVQENLARQTKEGERAELARQIAEEEKKVKNLETWVSDWARARQMREFITELEKVWARKGRDLSPEAESGQRIIWMKQQADRLDPMLLSPPSILDRRDEQNQW
jgi:hypothetical protein